MLLMVIMMTYDQRSHGIVHVRHLYESHLPVLREELEGFHGEAVLGESIFDLFLRYRSPERVNRTSLSHRKKKRMKYFVSCYCCWITYGMFDKCRVALGG